MPNTELGDKEPTGTTTMTTTTPTISSIPSLHAFDERNTTWESYRDRISFYFKANRIESDDDKKALFLWSVGDAVYSLLESLVAPKSLTDNTITFTNVIEYLDQHYDSTRNIMTASFDFYTCIQKRGQSFQDWKAELCGKLKYCGFNSSCLANKPQERALRDMYVIGIRSQKIRQALLKETDPNLETAEKIILTAERLQADMRHFDNPTKKAESSVAKVHNIAIPKRTFTRKNSSTNNNSTSKVDGKPCDRCGGTDHRRFDCKYREFICNYCKRKGHLERVCKQRKDTNPTNYISTIYTISEVGTVRGSSTPLATQYISINGYNCLMEIDTGAVDTIIDTTMWKNLGSPRLHVSQTKLKCYGGSLLDVQGECFVDVIYNSHSYKLPIIIVNASRPSLMGLRWIHKLKLDLNNLIHGTMSLENSVHKVVDESDLQIILAKHQAVLNNELGHCTKIKGHIELKPDAKPKFFKSRTIPFAYTDAVKQEIQRNVNEGILQRIDTSEWAAPIVPVPKPNGTIRICGDFKITLNLQIWVDKYPIPVIDELLSHLNNGVKFSKLDLSDAYLQIELDDESKALAVINTPMGLFRYNRMPFGIANAPAVFQRVIEQVITDVPNCIAYLDDILITGQNEAEHLHTLDVVLCRLADFGFTCNPAKCSFFQDQVSYLGYIIDKHGKRPDPSRIEAILQMPSPKNVKQLEAFLGKVNYYRNFISNMSSKCKSLNHLRQKNVHWQWTSACQSAFNDLIKDISNITTLAHFDGTLPIVLATDASHYGIGAVLSHRTKDNVEKPLAHASRTLTKAEQHYSQIEKEALSIIFGIKKFHQYLAGRKFELVTDHRPLLAIFDPGKALPATTANRLHRWALFLTGYTYVIRYKSTLAHANADALSRLPIPQQDQNFNDDDDDEMSIVSRIQSEFETKWPIKATDIAAATDNDEVLRLIRTFTLTSWPSTKSKEIAFRPFFTHRNNLSVLKGCLMKDIQVVIPTALQDNVLRMLHDTHVGTVRMKQLARSYCWWPRMNKNIEEITKSCPICASLQPVPTQQFKSWDEPDQVWSRVHMDLLGPIWNSKWLVVIDAKSKYPVVADMGNNTSALNLIYTLEQIFDWFGPPKTMVTDNGPPFTSHELQQFFEKYGITHVTTAPYHPASNGIAERFVRSFKEALVKEQMMNQTDKSMALRRILRNFRWTPHSITGESPAKLMFQHTIRTPFDLMKPTETEPGTETTLELESGFSQSRSKSKFSVGQFVWMSRYVKNKRPKWEPAIVTKSIGSMVYLVQTPNGQQHTRHQNQLRIRYCTKSLSEDDLTLPDNLLTSNTNIEQVLQPTASSKPNQTIQTVSLKKYPQRNRRPPDRFE